jgi:hypothetical protein
MATCSRVTSITLIVVSTAMRGGCVTLGQPSHSVFQRVRRTSHLARRSKPAAEWATPKPASNDRGPGWLWPRFHSARQFYGVCIPFYSKVKNMRNGQPPNDEWPTPRGRLTRARIVDTAADLFAQHGVVGTSVEDIRRAAGSAAHRSPTISAANRA